MEANTVFGIIFAVVGIISVVKPEILAPLCRAFWPDDAKNLITRITGIVYLLVGAILVVFAFR